MDTNSDITGNTGFWRTLDRLQGTLDPLQDAQAYHDLLHQIPLPVWVEN